MQGAQTSRARFVFAGLATVLLLAAVLAVVLPGTEEAADAPAECLTAWNEDALALSDGVHAYSAHGYRETLVTQVDEQGAIQADAAQDGRCTVIFAAPNVDFEPDFGVRVLDQGRWTGLAKADGIAGEQIEAMQSDATATTNSTLLPDGRLAQG